MAGIAIPGKKQEVKKKANKGSGGFGQAVGTIGGAIAGGLIAGPGGALAGASAGANLGGTAGGLIGEAIDPASAAEIEQGRQGQVLGQESGGALQRQLANVEQDQLAMLREAKASLQHVPKAVAAQFSPVIEEALELAAKRSQAAARGVA